MKNKSYKCQNLSCQAENYHEDVENKKCVICNGELEQVSVCECTACGAFKLTNETYPKCVNCKCKDTIKEVEE